jgi:hypothetical protein
MGTGLNEIDAGMAVIGGVLLATGDAAAALPDGPTPTPSPPQAVQALKLNKQPEYFSR